VEAKQDGGVPKVLVALLLSVGVAAFLFGLYNVRNGKDINKAIQSYQAGKHSDAISILDEVIRRDANNTDAYMLRCRTYYQLEDYQHAKEDCTEAITLAPNSENAYYFRGLSLVELEKPVQAADDFSRVLELNPDHPYASDLKEFIGQYGPPGA
jgi:tetratricopeptide (TPR) repeat protein